MLDLERNYRVCAFHHEVHGGAHVHHDGRTRRVDIGSLEEALRIVRDYAEKDDSFDVDEFVKVVKRSK